MSDDESCSSCEMMFDIAGAEDDFDEEEEKEKERVKAAAKITQINSYKANINTENALPEPKFEQNISNNDITFDVPNLNEEITPPRYIIPDEKPAVVEKIYTPAIDSFVADTGQFACSVECCNSSLHTDAVIIGTYQLDEELNKRDGNIQLYKYEVGDSDVDTVTLCEKLEMPHGGVLDCKWNPASIDASSPLLACACASGALTLVTLRNDWRDLNESIKPLEIKASSKDPTGYLFLSLDWNNKHLNNESVKIACSESKGSVSVWDVETLELESRWAAHELCGEPSECWTVSFDDWNNKMLYSGADDGILKIWDLRQEQSVTSACSLTDYKGSLSTYLPNRHDAGVTSVCFSPYNEYYFASGSYDGIVRIFDKRKFNTYGGISTCQPLNSVDVGGGVWRMKWKKEFNEIAVASMHSGVHLLSCNEEEELSATLSTTTNISPLPPKPRISLCYNKHTSMAYGVDWCPGGKGIVSCSFYDHGAHFWRVPAH